MRLSTLTASALFVLAGVFTSAISTTAQAQPRPTPFKTLDDLDKCASYYRYDTGVCFEPLEDYAKKNPNQMFDIAKRARLQFTHWAALGFFDRALGAKPTAAQCKDEDLALAVISGLALPPDRKQKAIAEKIFSGPCHEAIKPAVLKDLNSSPTSYTRDHTCPILKAKGSTHPACDPAPVVKAEEPKVTPIPVVDLKSAKFGLTKVYAGPEGERVAIADVQGVKGAFVIYIEGMRSPFANTAVVHLEQDAGSSRTEYVREYEGKRWTTIVRRSGGQYTLFAPGLKEPLNLFYSDADTKKFDASKLTK